MAFPFDLECARLGFESWSWDPWLFSSLFWFWILQRYWLFERNGGVREVRRRISNSVQLRSSRDPFNRMWAPWVESRDPWLSSRLRLLLTFSLSFEATNSCAHTTKFSKNKSCVSWNMVMTIDQTMVKTRRYEIQYWLSTWVSRRKFKTDSFLRKKFPLWSPRQ